MEDGDFLENEFGREWENEVMDKLDKEEAKYALPSPKQCEPEEPRPEHLKVLKQLFGHKIFRPMQWKIINSIMNHKRDNCAIMTTGYGKSLCYQFPSVYIGGITLIISPLISLMEDQVLAMKIANIPACLLGTANTNQSETLAEIEDNKYSLVYLTPEFCTGDFGSKLLQKWYQNLSITLIAIDEAHCVSIWGHDFRFQYRKLGFLRDIMPTVPILAVTATATEKIRKDIISTLRLKNPQVLTSSFDRPNFYFAVNLKTPDIMHDLKTVMEQHQEGWKFSGPTIIYCLTRKRTEDISFMLKEMGLKCMAYHAGLSISVRKEVHEQFVKDKIDIVVATIAFGMGIDKPDVRNVIHYGISSSIEGYYQEAGRAGRDGLPAKCVVFYDGTDFNTHKFLIQSSSVSQREKKNKMMETVKQYIDTRKCRRRFILKYFEETTASLAERPDCCDNCLRNSTNPENEIYEGIDDEGKYDFTKDSKMFLKAIEVLHGKFGLGTYTAFLRGSKKKQLEKFTQNPLHGAGKDKSQGWWNEIGKLLIKFQYAVSVASNFNKFATLVNITRAGERFLKDKGEYLKDYPSLEILTYLKPKANIWISTSQSTSQTKSEIKHEKDNQESVSEKETRVKLYNMLIKKRLDLASMENCMPYMIASNKALMDMAEMKPSTLKEMENCQFDGFTATKLAKYGEAFINMIKNVKVESLQQSKTIEEVLIQHPMPEISHLSPSAQRTYILLKSGKSLNDIAKLRGFALGTIMSHLCDCMKFGYEVKLSQLEVTKDIAHTIIEAAKDVVTGLEALTPIKFACPDHITYNQVKAVVTYLKLREHINSLRVPFVEFEDCNYFQFYNSNQTPEAEISLEQKNIKVEVRDIKVEKKYIEVEEKPIKVEQKDIKVEQKDIKVEQKDIKMEELTDDNKLSQFIKDLEDCDGSNFTDEMIENAEFSSLRQSKIDPCQSSSYRKEDVKVLESFPDLAAICDDLETNIEDTVGIGSKSILIIDSDDEEPSVKRSKRNIIDSVLDSPESSRSPNIIDTPTNQSCNHLRNYQESSDCYGKVKYNSSDDESVTEPQTSNQPKKTVENVKLPPWLIHKRVA